MRSRHGQSRCIRSGFLARADWMRELDARPEEITNLDALHDLLMQVRQRRPNAEGVLPDNGQVFPFPELDPLGDTFGVLTEESGTTVVNWYAADAYNRLCRTMHQWYQEGLILRNASLRDEPPPIGCGWATASAFLHGSIGIHWTAAPVPVAQS